MRANPRVIPAAALWMCVATAAAAQEPARSFDELPQRVTTGETISVVDASGRSTKGKVADVSTAGLTLAVEGTRTLFAVDDIRRVERRRKDSVVNGILFGLA